jgi:hypothetical protein
MLSMLARTANAGETASRDPVYSPAREADPERGKAVNVSAKPSMGMLRQTLFETLEGLKSGKINPNQANAIAKVAQTLVNSVEVQIKFEQMKLESQVPGKLPEMDIVAQIGTSSGPAHTPQFVQELEEKSRREDIRASMKANAS